MLTRFSAGGQFLARDHSGLGVRQRFRQAHLQRFEQSGGGHHDQDMAAGVFGGAHVNRTHLQVRRFAGAESLLDFRQILVPVMDDLLGGSTLRQAGLDEVTAVQTRGLFQSRLVHR